MIRALNENDVDAFIKIRSDSLKMDPKSFGAMPNVVIDREQTILDLKQKNDENFILGYFDEDQLVGITGFIREQRAKTHHKGFVWGVFVYKEYRGRRIGKRLMEELIQKVESLEGIQKIVLSVSHTSDNACKMYERLGFVLYGREPNAMIWEDESIDTLLLQKVFP